MGALKLRFYTGQQFAQGGFGNIAQRGASLLARNHAAEELHADLKFPVMRPTPRGVAHILKVDCQS